MLEMAENQEAILLNRSRLRSTRPVILAMAISWRIEVDGQQVRGKVGKTVEI